MKRSTLTLSILTALLVSACGGSSSNDEQTKDPTPPKVTPTNPSTPSTGKTTPTTGNKDNAGTFGSSAGSSASSSSSDPTPPISSGSAPSGGKPIVVNPPKTDEHTDDSDEDEENKKKDKDGKETPQDLAQLEKEIGQLEAEIDAKQKEITNTLAVDRGTKWQAQSDAIKALLGRLSVTNPQAGEGLFTARALLDKGQACTGGTGTTCEQDYQAAKLLHQALIDAREKQVTAQADLEKLIAEKNKKAQKFALEEAKTGLKTAEIPVEKEYNEAKEALANATFADDEKTLEIAKLTAEKDKLNNRDKGFFNDQIKDLEAAIKVAPDDKRAALIAKKDEIAAQVKTLETRVSAITAELNTLNGEKLNTAETRNNAQTKFDELDKFFGNRGVAGVTGYNAANLLEITKAKKDNNNWVIIFKDAEDDPITIGSGATYEIKPDSSGDAIAKFQKLNIGNAAFAEGKTNGDSIYGYVGERFYSVGKVTLASNVEKITDLTPFQYDGNALLKANKNQDMIAKFTGFANFSDKKFTGYFTGFKKYEPQAAEIVAKELDANSPLKDKTIQFAAKIEGNKFKTLDEKKSAETANVYGYFYGEAADGKPAEVGGLVEFKDVFHGSFGGAK